MPVTSNCMVVTVLKSWKSAALLKDQDFGAGVSDVNCQSAHSPECDLGSR